MEIIIILVEDNKHSIRIFWAAFQTSLYSRQATNLLTMLVDVWTFGEHWSEVQSSNLQQTIPDVKQYQIRIRQLKLKVVKNNCRFFHFISQFYGRAHNAKAFLKCAPLDSVRGLVRPGLRKDLNPRLRNGVRELATEPGCLDFLCQIFFNIFFGVRRLAPRRFQDLRPFH